MMAWVSFRGARSVQWSVGSGKIAVDSLECGMEAVGAEPKPREKDEARVHVALGLVATVAGEDCVFRPS